MSEPSAECRQIERITPRIDTEAICGCVRTITWDEVFGWVHTAPADRPYPPCPVPRPVPVG
jgi:hypothetical protein